MRLPQPLLRGRLVSRYKRFFADVVLDEGREVTAHCPNPGAMLGLNAPGLPVWLSASDNPKRKLAFTLEMVEDGAALVGVNTMAPRICRQAFDLLDRQRERQGSRYRIPIRSVLSTTPAS